MKAITIEFKDLCREFSGKPGTTTYHSVTFTKKQYPTAAARLAKEELAKVGILHANVYNRKPTEWAANKEAFAKYLTQNSVGFVEILEPTVKITTI